MPDINGDLKQYLEDFYAADYPGGFVGVDTQSLIVRYLEEEFADEDYNVRWQTLMTSAREF